MNCKQFNSIKLEEVLFSLGQLPTKHNEKEAWFLNPFGTETEASFKLDKRNNIWYLHSEGIGGNNTDFMMKYLRASVKEVLEWAEKQNFSSFQPQNQSLKTKVSHYQITIIKKLENENLKSYLKQRELSPKIYPFLKEIYFTVGDKKLYAIGFQNNSDGWELRNSFYKGSLLKKDISVINMNNQIENKNVAVFEGFIDALSFVEMKPFFNGDLLVMNSISLLNKAKEYLKNYSEIHLFLDNDNAGEHCKNSILKSFPEAKNHSEIYFPHKDLNEYWISVIKTKIDIQQQDDLKLKQKDKENESTEAHQIYQRKR
ncbi:toprim domain-containing protein [Chryseobacterium binzhouense]|uniref:toprim domain-containing protein n=1 Tax=Chryseobacterium binzhouense TaxID=2593646 RepID=UPI00289881DE|nr:toprim domain-containing protein [Chryseobacterium binzhouense]